jgi:hypothetical protein
MSIATELTALSTNITSAYTALEDKGATIPTNKNTENLATAIESISGSTPSTTTGGLFTGATMPLTYYNNSHTFENTYEYASPNYNITLSGLDNATITNNGTKNVTVVFDVTSTTSSLDDFVITLSDGTNTYTYKGLHAHYGTNVTGVLTFAYTNIPRTGTGTIGTEYKFIETTATYLPYFSTDTTLWNTIYSYQVLNTLVGNVTSIGDYFLSNCYSFNQPLDLSNITSIGNYFLQSCSSFNQPLDISNLTSIGDYFLHYCYSFNQPLDISNLTSISNGFLQGCRSFNQPLDLSNITSIGNYFLYYCYSFNQPLDLSNITSIGVSFLQGCYSFNQNLVIPNSLNSIGTNFMQQCYSLSTITYTATVFPTDNNALAQDVNSKTSTNGAGILVFGTQRAGLLTALPNRTSNPYRKLINGRA